jgi:phage-related protein
VKFIAKTFYKAAKFTGKVVKAVGKGAINLGKRFVKFVKKVGVKGVMMAALAINPSKLVVKFGWKAIKFVGKSIWKGIKKLAFNALSFFGMLFGLMGKFVNKVGHWIGILAHGIADKTYRFIVKPLASMMVSIFNFVTAVVLSPIQFIKWLIPTVIDKIMDVLSSIAQAVKNVMKSTWSIFKKILCNPITIALLIGGLFFFLWKWLGPTLSGGISKIRDTVVPIVKSFVKGALKFVTGLWNIIVLVGKTLFTWIEKITNPEGFLAKFIVGVVKTFIAIKRGIKDLMKAAGKNSIDILCMFLAGDMIGIIIASISGLMGKLWMWLKKTKVVSFIVGIVKSVLAIGKLIFSLNTLILRTLCGAVWQMVKGNFGGVVDAITKPWKNIWTQIKDVFSFKAFKEEMSIETLHANPTEANAEQAKNTSISVRNLKMKGSGKAEENLVYFNKLQSELSGAQYGDLLPRIQKMNQLYQENSRQVESYDEFLTKTWEIGQGGDDIAQQLLKQMLESPEVSQKLLSVFFYYNP